MRNIQKLKTLVDIISGYPFESSLFNTEGHGLPLIRVRDVNSGYAGVYYSGDYDENFLIQNGDLLIGLDGDFKCVEWRFGKALLNQRVCKIIPKHDKISKLYLLHFLPAALSLIHRNTNFTTVKHLSTKTILEIQIPAITLSGQLQISNILNRAEILITQRKESIRLLDEFLKSTFLEMFGTKSYPKYETDTLENYSIKITDGTHLGPKFIDFGVPFLLVSNIKNNEIDYNTKKYISEKEYQELNKRTPIEKGDILITSVGSYGNPALVKTITKFAFQRHIAYIKPDMNKINNVYLFGALKSDFVKIQIDNAVRGVAQKTLNLSELKKISIPIPPIELQIQFANIEEKTETLKVQYQNSLQELENLYHSLSQQAFKGELNAKDEELLMAAEPQVEYITSK